MCGGGDSGNELVREWAWENTRIVVGATLAAPQDISKNDIRKNDRRSATGVEGNREGAAADLRMFP